MSCSGRSRSKRRHAGGSSRPAWTSRCSMASRSRTRVRADRLASPARCSAA